MFEPTKLCAWPRRWSAGHLQGVPKSLHPTTTLTTSKMRKGEFLQEPARLTSWPALSSARPEMLPQTRLPPPPPRAAPPSARREHAKIDRLHSGGPTGNGRPRIVVAASGCERNANGCWNQAVAGAMDNYSPTSNAAMMDIFLAECLCRAVKSCIMN